MKRLYVSISVLLLTLSLTSCRETEVNTDGNMEENEVRQVEPEE